MGMWLDDSRHGSGIIVTLDGLYFEGNFSYGKMTVSLTFIFQKSLSVKKMSGTGL